MNPLRVASVPVALSALLSSAAALADPRVGAIVGVRGGYSTNPYSSNTGDSGSGTITGNISPKIVFDAPTGTTQISGDITHTEFSRTYSGATDYSVYATTKQQITPRISIDGGANYSSQFRNALFPSANPNDPPGAPDDPIILDPSGAATLAQRVRSYGGNLGASITLSPLDSLNLYAQYSAVKFKSGESQIATSYDTTAGGFSYMRTINPTTSIGAGLNVSRSNYYHSRFGDGTQISPSFILNTRFSARLSLNVSLGLTFSDTDLLVGSARRTSFSGSGTLCHTGERSSFCLDGSRSISPTAISGISTVTSVGLSYRYQLSGRDSFNLGASYSSASRIYGDFRERYDYASGTAGYQRRLTDRLSANASVAYSDSYRTTFSRKANIWGTIGISYRLGDI